MPNVSILLLITAFVTCVISMMGKCPLWVSVLLLIVWAFLQGH